MFTNEANFTGMIECWFAHCYHLRNHTQRFVEKNYNVNRSWWRQHSHHKHEYVTKEVEHGVKMMTPKEVQFCLYLILAYSEAGVNFSYTGVQPTSTNAFNSGIDNATLIKGVCVTTRSSPLAQNVDHLKPKLSLCWWKENSTVIPFFIWVFHSL